jgi:hypothetical protein
MNYMTRTVRLAVAILLGFSAAAHAQPLNQPSPIPLPVANVTVPLLHAVQENGGVTSVLDQVKKLEQPGSMPVLFVLTQGDTSKDPQPWSLITSIHVRMFTINAQANPEASDYLLGTHTLTQTAYAIDKPPTVAGQKSDVFVWENERDGVLTQAKLEFFYKQLKIDVDPLTSPSLNEASWNALLINAANNVPNAPTRVVILAFRSNGSDPDVVTTTRLRILAGVEFIKSIKAPITELDEDAHVAIASKLFGGAPPAGPALIVFNLTDRRIEETYDPSKLSSLTETDFQTFAEKNGVPSFLTNRTDVAEAFVRIADTLRKQQAANSITPSGGLIDAGPSLVKQQ